VIAATETIQWAERGCIVRQTDGRPTGSLWTWPAAAAAYDDDVDDDDNVC